MNEALTHTDLPYVDAIEIYNPTDSDADIRGWYLTDDVDTPAKALVPDELDYVIEAGGYAVIYETDFNENPGAVGDTVLPGFSLSSHGDEEVYIFSADRDGVLTGYSHGYEIEAAENGVSFGRYVSSDDNEHFVAQVETSLGAENYGPQIGPVVISEIFYNPLDSDMDTEYLELVNISEYTVNFWDDSEGGAPENTLKSTVLVSSFPNTPPLIRASG